MVNPFTPSGVTVTPTGFGQLPHAAQLAAVALLPPCTATRYKESVGKAAAQKPKPV